MDANAQQELYAIRSELQSIIDELRDISSGVRSDFSGIGNDRCAKAITVVADQYEQAKRKLNRIDTTKVTEGFVAQGGGGSFRGGGASRSF